MKTFDPLTSNTNSTAIDFQGLATVSAVGTFNGATVTAYVSFNGGSNYIVPTDSSDANLALTAAGAKNIQAGKCKLKVGMTGADESNVVVTIINLNEIG